MAKSRNFGQIQNDNILVCKRESGDTVYTNDAESRISDMDVSQRLIIYCIGAHNQPLKDRMFLQKILFLLQQSIPDIIGEEYTFQKYKMGPYSEKIDEDVSVMCNSNLINSYDMSLSNIGLEYYKIINSRIKEPLRSNIDEIEEFVKGMSDDELLTFIYVVYPDYKENSEKWNKLSIDRRKHAVSLLKKEKVTFSLAALIADMNFFEFEDYLKNKHVRWKS